MTGLKAELKSAVLNIVLITFTPNVKGEVSNAVRYHRSSEEQLSFAVIPDSPTPPDPHKRNLNITARIVAMFRGTDTNISRVSTSRRNRRQPKQSSISDTTTAASDNIDNSAQTETSASTQTSFTSQFKGWIRRKREDSRDRHLRERSAANRAGRSYRDSHGKLRRLSNQDRRPRQDSLNPVARLAMSNSVRSKPVDYDDVSPRPSFESQDSTSPLVPPPGLAPPLGWLPSPSPSSSEDDEEDDEDPFEDGEELTVQRTSSDDGPESDEDHDEDNGLSPVQRISRRVIPAVPSRSSQRPVTSGKARPRLGSQLREQRFFPGLSENETVRANAYLRVFQSHYASRYTTFRSRIPTATNPKEAEQVEAFRLETVRYFGNELKKHRQELYQSKIFRAYIEAKFGSKEEKNFSLNMVGYKMLKTLMSADTDIIDPERRAQFTWEWNEEEYADEDGYLVDEEIVERAQEAVLRRKEIVLRSKEQVLIKEEKGGGEFAHWVPRDYTHRAPGMRKLWLQHVERILGSGGFGKREEDVERCSTGRNRCPSLTHDAARLAAKRLLSSLSDEDQEVFDAERRKVRRHRRLRERGRVKAADTMIRVVEVADADAEAEEDDQVESDTFIETSGDDNDDEEFQDAEEPDDGIIVRDFAPMGAL